MGEELLYWRFDIDNLCVAQKGLTLSALQNIYAGEMARIEHNEMSRLDWRRQCVGRVKGALADRVWEVWSGDSKYSYARGTFAAHVTKKKLQHWLGLTERHFPTDPRRFLNIRFSEATSTVDFARMMGKAWVEDMADQLLAQLRVDEEYTGRCVCWHHKRIMAELERAHMLNVASLCNKCSLCHVSLGPNLGSLAVAGFLVHVQTCHEEFWEDGSWTIVSSARVAMS